MNEILLLYFTETITQKMLKVFSEVIVITGSYENEKKIYYSKYYFIT